MLLFWYKGVSAVKIKKILNNNVVIAKDDDGHEVIVMSTGLGFSKKAGDIFRRQDAQKIFVLSDEVKGKYGQLMGNVDPVATEIAENVITYATEQKNLRLNDIIHLTLTDHIDGVLTRLREGVYMTNQLTMEIKRVYNRDFGIGLYANKLIKEKTGLEPNVDEAAFIAMHFMNNRLDCNNNDETISQTIAFVDDTMKLLETYFKVKLNEDSLYYYRFVSHLKCLLKRIIDGTTFTDDPLLYDTVSRSYENSAKCAAKIANMIKLKYHKDVSSEEKAYITIYVEKLIRECNKK